MSLPTTSFGEGLAVSVGDTEGDVDGRDVTESVKVHPLVVEEDVGLEHIEDARLLDTAEEEDFVHFDIQLPEGGHHSLVRRCVACRDDGRLEDTPVGVVSLVLITLKLLEDRDPLEQDPDRAEGER